MVNNNIQEIIISAFEQRLIIKDFDNDFLFHIRYICDCELHSRRFMKYKNLFNRFCFLFIYKKANKIKYHVNSLLHIFKK